ncbi:hypothetical protein [Peptostreptococcus equinus]|uniref:Uncharacterized protein n=1 Tax=Peptostreptococcus equinus TaxID=3003601 RepID=A0ABY7JML6_9FIRM|nr:hypothetical protein [Peptostreptococcus sp. CBA3647]WAW14606.1 hypothetical protein O0R46_08385 [Peptostreptococcus sp. CBA3647]
MSNLVKINNQEITLKEWKGQRVVTFADIDYVHGSQKGQLKEILAKIRNILSKVKIIYLQQLKILKSTEFVPLKFHQED